MAKDVWEIKHVPENTKRSIKAYAAVRGLTIAEALTHRFDPPLLSRKHDKEEKEKKEEREEKEKARIRTAPPMKGVGGRVLSEDERSSPGRKHDTNRQLLRCQGLLLIGQCILPIIPQELPPSSYKVKGSPTPF